MARAGGRRWSLNLGLAVLVGVLTLAACSNEVATPVKPTRTTADPVLLTVAVYGPAPVVTAYTQIASDFTAAHKDIVVNVRPFGSHAEFERDFRRYLAVPGQADEPDVFVAERGDLPGLVAARAIQPVDTALIDRGVDFGDGFAREALEDFSADSALQCMPVDTSPLVVYYNTDLIDIGGLVRPGEKQIDVKSPWTMDQFVRAARTASHGRFRGVYVEPSLAQVAPFIWSGGGRLVDSATDPTTLELSDGPSVGALEQLLELVRDPALTFDERQIARLPALNRFKAGKLGMILGYRDLTPELRKSRPGLHFDVLPLPRLQRSATSGSMRGLCMSAGTGHPDQAADLIAYAVSDEPSSVLAATGYVVPTNVDVSNSDAFLQPGQMPVNATTFTRASRWIQQTPVGAAWHDVDTATVPLLTRLFYDPVIDPLEERLTAIDQMSRAIFTARAATPAASPSAGSTP